MDAGSRTPGGFYANATGGGIIEDGGGETAEIGIGGLFGARRQIPIYRTTTQVDPNYAANRNAIGQQMNRVAGAPTQTMSPSFAGAARIDQSQAQQARSMGLAARTQQTDFVNALRGQAFGTSGPSAAQAQLQAGTDAAMSSALALARSGRGGNASVAMKSALDQQGQTMQQSANAAAALRAQEQQAAQAQLGQAISSMRSGDMQMRDQDFGSALAQSQFMQQANLANAGFANDASRANLMAGVQQQQNREALVQQYMQMGLSADQAAYQAAIQQNQFNAKLLADQQGQLLGVGSNSDASAQLLGAGVGAMGAMAGAAMASDERAKTEIKDGSKKVESFLEAIGTHSYRYKEPHKPLRGEGEFVSPMAQEIEKTELGKSMVKEAPDGTKIVDYGKSLGAQWAAMAMLFKRIKQLEGADA